MKTIFTFLLILVSFISFSQVRISQVYGGGGNPAASYTNDFVELFNAGATTVDISNWSIQYASATGTIWAVAGIPAVTNIAAGKYFLVALGSGGAAGIALPAPDLTNTGINISNTTGKVALVNNTTALNGTTACSDISVVDVIGYGASATCFETATAITTGIDNTMSQLRGSAGCDDTNNNSSDFSFAAVSPRNSASAANLCGPAVALLSVFPGNMAIFSSVGTASIEQSFTLSGSNLTGFPGNILVTASAGLEISLTSGAGYTGSVNVAYGSATLNATIIYVRLTGFAVQGPFNGTVTCSGGGAASNAIVTINGGVYQDYYNTKANNGLNDISTWSATPAGSGASPADFTSAYQSFHIINENNAHYSGVWNVTGPGNTAKVIVGTGVQFTIPAGADSVTSATRIDVMDGGVLILQNNRLPFLNNLATGSSVEFKQAGITSADTIRIPSISFYNLSLFGGLKYFSGGVTTVRAEFYAENVQSMNGSSPTFSTLNAFKNVTFWNCHFEPAATGDAARMTLAMNGNGMQNIFSTNINTVDLFRLQRDSVLTNSVITLDGTLNLGNAAGGGLRLSQGPATTTVLQLAEYTGGIDIKGAGTVTPSANGKISSIGFGGVVGISKSAGNANAGVLRFVSNTLLSFFRMNCSPAFARDSIIIADSVNVESLFLQRGRIIVNPGAVLTMSDGGLLAGGHITGGSATAFVDGKLRRAGLQSLDFHFPVGKADKYAPVDINNVMQEDITVEYFFTDFGNHTIDPATLTSFPGYNISDHEYWVITKNNTTIPDPDITFHYTDGRSGIIDPTQVKIAHFDATDWDDLGGTADASNTTTNGFVMVAGVSTFSPFTFSARTTGVLPVRLTSFTAHKQDKVVKLNWSTSQEINSSHFSVQRSVDGRTWKDIASVNASGNSNAKINYTTTDNDPVKGINFYRLKEVDINGKFDYSETRSVLFSSSFDVSINPNPATDFVNVFISKENNNPSTIILTDMNGRLINKYITSETTYKISTNLIAPGVYYVRVRNDEHEVVRKLVVY